MRTYGRFDAEMRDHAKWLSLSPLAYKLGVRLVLWARAHAPDTGFVPDCVVFEYARTKVMQRKLAAELVECGAKVGRKQGILVKAEGGFTINGFLEHDDAEGDGETFRGDEMPPAPPKASRVEAGRLGGLRSAAARAANGSAQPRRPEANSEAPVEAKPQASRSTPEAPPEAPSRSTPEAPRGLSLGSSSGFEEEEENPGDPLLLLPEDGSGENARGDERTSSVQRIAPKHPRTSEEALTWPVMERARYVSSLPPFEAQWFNAQDWPEVRQVFALFAAAWKRNLGQPGNYGSDPGTRAAVALLASFTLEEIATIAERIEQNPVVRRNRSLAIVSPEVARRTLGGDYGAPRLGPARGPIQTSHGTGFEALDEQRRQGNQ